jgi:hypothetical protein
LSSDDVSLAEQAEPTLIEGGKRYGRGKGTPKTAHPIAVTNRQASELQRKVRKHSIDSLTPQEREAFRVVERRAAQLATNPAYQKVVKALRRQLPAYQKAERILSQLPPRERARYDDWTPADFLRVHGARPSRRPTTVARARPTRGSRANRQRAPGREPGGDEPPPLARACGFCGASLEGRRRNVRYCSDSHRVRACQLRRDERRALVTRYLAALEIVPELGREERLDLLAAVVWPSDSRLRAAA